MPDTEKIQPDPLPTRDSLLSRLKNWGDEKSWSEFFETYWELIYKVAIGAGLADAEAQDVVQETVITVAKKIQTFKKGREHGTFKSWLARVTRNRIYDQYTKRKRQGPGSA